MSEGNGKDTKRTRVLYPRLLQRDGEDGTRLVNVANMPKKLKVKRRVNETTLMLDVRDDGSARVLYNPSAGRFKAKKLVPLDPLDAAALFEGVGEARGFFDELWSLFRERDGGRVKQVRYSTHPVVGIFRQRVGDGIFHLVHMPGEKVPRAFESREAAMAHCEKSGVDVYDRA